MARRHPHLPRPDLLASAAIAGALAGLTACLVLATTHGALVVTSDAAAAVGLAALLSRRLDDALVRLVAALDIAVLAMTYAGDLGAVTAASILLATVLIAAPAGPHPDR